MIENTEYIDLLRKHSEFSKTKNKHLFNNEHHKQIQKRLLEIEKAIPSEEILYNTKVAFPEETKE